MQHQNRITYRFDRNGNKIDALQQHPVVNEANDTKELNIEQLEQLIRNADGVIANAGEATSDLIYATRSASGIDYRSQYELDLDELDLAELGSTINEERLLTEETDKVRQADLDRYELEASRFMYNSEQPNWTAPILHDDAISGSKLKRSWMSGLIAVLCAVLTGTLLGYLLLVQVFGSSIWPNSETVATTITTITTNTEDKPTTALTDLDENASMVALNMSEAQYSYQMLQAGVFSKTDSRDELIAAMQRAGYAAEYLEATSDQFFVYTAIATSVSNIEPFKNAVSGFELYRKELVLQLPGKLQYNGEATQIVSYIESSNQLISMYANLAAAQLEQPSLSVIGASAAQAWQEQYEQWETIAQKAIDGFKGTENESQAIQLQQLLQLAQQQLLKYQQKPSAKNIWEVEAAIIKAVLVQKEWFE